MDEWMNGETACKVYLVLKCVPSTFLNYQKTVTVSDAFNWKSITQRNAIQLCESALLSGMEGKLKKEEKL